MLSIGGTSANMCSCAVCWQESAYPVSTMSASGVTSPATRKRSNRRHGGRHFVKKICLTQSGTIAGIKSQGRPLLSLLFDIHFSRFSASCAHGCIWDGSIGKDTLALWSRCIQFLVVFHYSDPEAFLNQGCQHSFGCSNCTLNVGNIGILNQFQSICKSSI